MKRAPLIALAVALLAAPAYAQPEGSPAQPEGSPAQQDEPEAAAPNPVPPSSPPETVEGDAATEVEDELETPSAPAQPAEGAVPTVAAPSALLERYALTGEFREPRETLRAFLDQRMPIGQPWDEEQKRAVLTFLAKIDYDAEIVDEAVSESRVVAHVELIPIEIVRYVDVEAHGGTKFPRSLVEDRIFSEDILRRMRLKVGSKLPRATELRDERLRAEERRLVNYLRDEGFFEAVVTITVAPKADNAVELDVEVLMGPPYYVGEVRVVGNREISDKEIADKFIHHRLDLFRHRFNRTQLKKDIDAVTEMYQKRGFPGVRVRTDFDRSSFKRDRQRVDFTVIIRERRRIEVYFEGYNKVRERGLREELTLSEEGTYDDFEIERSAQAIRRMYQTRGYFEATVNWDRVSFRLPDQVFDRVVFSIDEGPQLKVESIEFVGNTAVTDTSLRETIKTREYPRFFLVSGGYATSLQLDQDARRIADLYRARGYADVEVRYEATRDRRLLGSAPALAAAIVSDLPAQGLFIRFVIDEGPVHRVERVTFEFDGPHDRSAATLAEVVSLYRGSAYTAANAQADRDRLSRYYFQNGFPYATVETEVVPIENARVALVHKIREGRPVRFGKVALRGNFKTEEWVIREELDLPEGAPFTLGRAERAQRNLRTSGLFKTARFDYVGFREGNQGSINVLLQIEERYDYLFEWLGGGGASTDRGLFGIAGVTVPHIGGIGLRLDLKTELGTEIRSLDGKLLSPRWVQRHLFGVGFRTELSGFWREEDTERFGPLTSYGGTIGVGIEGQVGGDWDGWFLGLRYDFRQRNREVDSVRPAGPSDDIEKTPVQTRTGAVGPQLVIDRRTDEQGRRNPLAPKGGFRVEGSALFANTALLGDDDFVKLGFKSLHYWTFGERFTLTNGIRYDHGIPLGGAVLLPEVERFFAGGDTTVRGFEEDRLLTEIIEVELPPLGDVTEVRVLPAGGNIRFIHNIELEALVWDKSFIGGLPWASAIFVDSGLVTNSLDGFDISDLRHSLGIAFWRLVTPVGSLSVEWAVPLDPRIGDNPRGRLHLNLGFVFK